MRATSFLPTTLRLRAPTFRSAICRGCPLIRSSCESRCEALQMHGALHDAPRTSDVSVFLSFRGGRFFFPRRRPSFHPLTLPSPRAAYPLYLLACASAAFAFERRPPLTGVRRRLRARGRDHLPTKTRDGLRRTDDPERLPSGGRSLAPRGLPLAAFRFVTQHRSPVAACLHDDDAVRPTSATAIRS